MATVVAQSEQDRANAVRARALSLKRQLQAALVCALIVSLALVGGAIFAADRLYNTAEERYVREAIGLRTATLDLILRVADEDASVRGFLITGRPSSLGPYRVARRAARADLAALETDVRERPRIAADVAAVRRQIGALERYFESQIALVQRGRAGRLQAQRRALGGEERFGRFRGAAGRLSAEIDEVVAAAQRQQRRTYRRSLVFLIADGAIAAAIGIALLLVLPRRFQRLYRRELDARRRAERGARAARALSHVDEAVMLLDSEDVIAYWNAGAEMLFGAAQANVVGKPVQTVVSDFAAIEQTAADRERNLLPLTVAGEERWFLVAQTSFPEGRVVVLRDVTEGEALERARTDFVATAAHELRTPVSAVFGAARTLRRTDVELPEPTRAEFLAMIESESDRLGRIIEQILTAAELDRGDLALQAERCNLRAMCENAIRAVEATRPAGISIDLDAPGAIEPIVCDEGRLRQVLENLLGNAVKYSPDGGRIALRLRDGGGRVRIDVQDEGLGIPRSERERIFEKFYRLDPALTRGVGGSGLGLYISRQLVEQMGGRISVTSQPGEGSTFTVELPRR